MEEKNQPTLKFHKEKAYIKSPKQTKFAHYDIATVS